MSESQNTLKSNSVDYHPCEDGLLLRFDLPAEEESRFILLGDGHKARMLSKLNPVIIAAGRLAVDKGLNVNKRVYLRNNAKLELVVIDGIDYYHVEYFAILASTDIKFRERKEESEPSRASKQTSKIIK